MVLLRAQTKPERLQISLCFSLAFKLGDADDLIASQSLVWTERGRGRAREGSRSQIPAAIPFKSHLRIDNQLFTLPKSKPHFQYPHICPIMGLPTCKRGSVLRAEFRSIMGVEICSGRHVFQVDLYVGGSVLRANIQSAPKVVSQPSRPSLSLPLATHRSHSQNHLNQPGCALQECR